MKKYNLSELSTSIGENGIIFDDGSVEDVEIYVEEWVKAHYCLVPQANKKLRRHVSIASGGEFSGSAIFCIDSGELNFTTEVCGDSVKSHLSLLSIAKNDSTLSLSGVAKVSKPYRNIITRIDQTNILIGEWANVRGIPKLEIATEDITWWHSCKVHRLGGDALFYLESRWLEKEHAEAMLLNSEILKHLSTIEDEEEKKRVCYDIHTLLKK
jgi:Fe-S cluster assembly protein SufD